MADRYALIGHPVAHSKSPLIHAAFARATRQDMEYGLIDPGAAGFAAAVEAFRAVGGRGLNVTLPFKEEAFRYCARTSERAARAQAVNTLALAELYGDNTDGIGLVRDLATLGMSVAGKAVLLMGAGGAARGVLPALLGERASRVVVANRTVGRAQELAAYFGVQACGYDALSGESFDVVVNATSSGLGGHQAELPPGLLREGVLAYDMVYGADTPFLAAARRAGARASDGLGMLVEQAAEAFFVWRGVRPDTAAVLRELRGG